MFIVTISLGSSLRDCDKLRPRLSSACDIVLITWFNILYLMKFFHNTYLPHTNDGTIFY
jgi:hypothetical protein